MRIGWLSSDWSMDYLDEHDHPTPGGTGWYRVHMPARALAANGFDVVVGSIPDTTRGWITLRDWDLVEHDDLDVIVVQRWMHEGAADAIRKARANGQVVVSDVDDWYKGLATTSVAFDRTHPRAGTGLLNRAHARFNKAQGGGTVKFNRNHMEAATAASSAVICSTPFLAEKYGRSGRPVFLCRNAIDMDRWPFRNVWLGERKPSIGWVGSTATRSGDLEVAGLALRTFYERHGVSFFHGGHFDASPSFAELAGLPPAAAVLLAEQLPIGDYPLFFRHFDVGVVPLSDRSFNHAKSGIKGMEYTAAGIPFIASALPEYQWLHDEHGIGRLARRPRDWLRHLEELRDPDLRFDEGKRQRDLLRDLDISVRWVDWARAITGALVASV